MPSACCGSILAKLRLKPTRIKSNIRRFLRWTQIENQTLSRRADTSKLITESGTSVTHVSGCVFFSSAPICVICGFKLASFVTVFTIEDKLVQANRRPPVKITATTISEIDRLEEIDYMGRAGIDHTDPFVRDTSALEERFQAVDLW